MTDIPSHKEKPKDGKSGNSGRGANLKIVPIVFLITGVILVSVLFLSPGARSVIDLSQGGQDQSADQKFDGPVEAPSFKAKEITTGETVSLSTYAGTPVLLNFVNYGCSQGLNVIVSEQLLTIQEITSERDDFVPISVFCGCCSEDTLKAFTEENEFDWPWILDSDYTILRDYSESVGIYNYPTLLLIDGDQQIVEMMGATDAEALNEAIDKIV